MREVPAHYVCGGGGTHLVLSAEIAGRNLHTRLPCTGLFTAAKQPSWVLNLAFIDPFSKEVSGYHLHSLHKSVRRKGSMYIRPFPPGHNRAWRLVSSLTYNRQQTCSYQSITFNIQFKFIIQMSSRRTDFEIPLGHVSYFKIILPTCLNISLDILLD